MKKITLTRTVLLWTICLAWSVASMAQDGWLDNTFGTNGKVITPVGTGNAYGHSVATQSDGKIVVAGYGNNGSYSDFALVRYNTDGSLDNTFGTNGKATTDIGNVDDYGYSVAIQSDGKIVVVGSSFDYNGSFGSDFALVRYNTDGSLDNTFGTNGKIMTAVRTSYDQGFSVAIQSDGKIVVAGYSYQGIDADFALVRYNTDGSLDNTFGTNGKIMTAVGTYYDSRYSVVIQSDGKIVVAGTSYNGSNYDFALVRYNTDGSLDNAFGTNGKVTTAIGNSNDYGRFAAIQSDGKIVVVGYSFNGSNYHFALVRYNTDGSLDNTFGIDGKLCTVVGTYYDEGLSVAIQSDGKIVVAGTSFNYSGDAFAVVRYNNTIPTTTTADTITQYICKTAQTVSISPVAKYDGYTTYSWTDNVGTVIATTEALIDVPMTADSTTFLCTMTKTGYITTLLVIVPRYKPVANFSYQENCQFRSVQFTNLSTTNRGILSYTWDFGDGSTSTDENPLHTYATTVVHTVSLKVDNPPSTCDSVITKSVVSCINTAETITQYICKTAQTVSISPVAKYDGYTTYSWTDNVGTVIATTEALIDVPMTADSTTFLCTMTKTGYITTLLVKVLRYKPVANFSYQENCESGSVQFTNLSTTNRGTLSYTWDFGDGSSTSTEENPLHTFATTGSYTVSLKVDNPLSACNSVISQSVVVTIPQADFELSSITVDEKHNEITCSVPPLDNVVYSWDMGDGTTETGAIIHHTYFIDRSLVSYTITLTATTNNGCALSKAKLINIIPFIPNVFTPNGDGTNDLFMAGYDVTIYDRNGKKIFEGKTGWDGSYKGSKADTDTYFYSVKYSVGNQQTKTKQGYITLMR